MKSGPPFRSAARIRASATCCFSGCRSSRTPTRTAKAKSYSRSPGWSTKSSIATCRKLRTPVEISAWEPEMACAIAFAERSIPSTCPLPMRSATARAATPGPQPISRTLSPRLRGRDSTTSSSLGEMLPGTRYLQAWPNGGLQALREASAAESPASRVRPHPLHYRADAPKNLNCKQPTRTRKERRST